eukprot:s3684_g5.t2
MRLVEGFGSGRKVMCERTLQHQCREINGEELPSDIFASPLRLLLAIYRVDDDEGPDEPATGEMRLCAGRSPPRSRVARLCQPRHHSFDQNRQLSRQRDEAVARNPPVLHTCVKYVDATDDEKETIMKGVGCYCKKVQSRDDCPSIKANHDVSAPNRYRWYHEDAGEGLCCKMAWTSLFTWVGFQYTRQETMDLCVSEVRPAPSTACCHLKNDQGPVGLRVKQTNSEAWVQGSVERRFRKVLAFSLEDVLGSTDHTGVAIDVEDVQGFLENGLDAGRFQRLECEETELMEDSRDCLLRTRPSSECCCHQAGLILGASEI